jgi:hypothetical protein
VWASTVPSSGKSGADGVGADRWRAGGLPGQRLGDAVRFFSDLII